MTDLRTCLWFETDAEAAVAFYTALIPDSEIEQVLRPAADAPPVVINFTLAGVPYSALQAGPGPVHSPAASIAVECPQAEADLIYDRLVGNGGAADRCGWVTDRWGISWQVIPTGLHAALFGADPAANARAHAAMLQMKKLNLAGLESARNHTQET